MQYAEIELINKLFDLTRMIDLEKERVCSQNLMNRLINPPELVSCNIEARKALYQQCVQSEHVVYHLEQVQGQIILYTLLPIRVDQQMMLMEGVANITGRMDLDTFIKQSSTFNSAHQLSVTDDLTGLYNRRYINQALPRMIDACEHQGMALSIIFADLDYFKQINDRFGHLIGDYLLQAFAQELQNSVQNEDDWVARYGGDEFLLCLRGADYGRARQIAEQIRQSVEQKMFNHGGYQIKMTCSLGIHTISEWEKSHSYHATLDMVDQMLMQAKDSGRNKVC